MSRVCDGCKNYEFGKSHRALKLTVGVLMVTISSFTVNILREDFAHEPLLVPNLFRENAPTLPMARQHIKKKEVIAGHTFEIG